MADKQNKLTDQSSDRKYFIMTPQLVWALSRDPYDFTLWNVVKMVAGEHSECYLSTEQLAALAMMSMGKVSNCRKYLIACGLLEGEIRRDPGYPQPVWHLKVPNLWPANVAWRTGLGDSLLARIEYKRTQKAKSKKSLHQVKPPPEGPEPPSEESLHQVKPPAKESLHQVKPSPGEEGPSPGEEGPSPGETKKNQKKNQTTTNDGDDDDPMTDERTARLLKLAQAEQKPLDLHLAHRLVKAYTLEQVVSLVKYTRQAKGLKDPLAFAISRLRSGELPVVVRPESATDPELVDCPGCREALEQYHFCQKCERCENCCVCEPVVVDPALAKAREIWEATLGELALQMNRGTFRSWLKPTRVLSRENGMFTIAVENEHVKEWLENRLHPTVMRTLTGIVKEDVEIAFVVVGKGAVDAEK